MQRTLGRNVKQLFALYTIIGIILTPLIYSNNAEGYRPANSSAYQWGKALGGAIYWPSYLFSIEPEVDSESLESFQKSVIDIVNYRNDKLFTGKRSDNNASMIFASISNCLALEGADKKNILSLYNEIFTENTKSKEIERIRSSVMQKMDGYDFADIVETGAECGDNLDKSPASATIFAPADTLTSEPTGGDYRSDNSAPVSISESVPPGVPAKQPETEHALQEAAKKADTERFPIQWVTDHWKLIQEDPDKYLRDCQVQYIQEAMSNGMSASEAAERIKESCELQLAEIKICMNKPSADASFCFGEVYGEGD